MIDKDEKKLISATKRPGGLFTEEELIKNIDEYFETLEYADVDECQIWEYPSGKIYAIQPDREVSQGDIYEVPHKDLWLPKLDHIDTNKEKVEGAYSRLMSKS